ncbi:porin [Marisediminitalea aggregata]|uniref:Porin n=2 Tax=Alteromonadaceae TaxID=72275 RepID=A0A1M5EVE7_9ALTE|nr:porin [Marisediminitalea aggregata]MAP22136.1 porin [Alteromonadaceae bacterium]MEC7826036.1 porin [Pseudomonadota bacterium]HBY41384.1 porin [Alteromonas sp.]MAX43134.1 porin [Alteromonadaceae bacterium]SHF83194.1 porin [Marisediminitalea aggregata]|tara:strand:+ start:76 stop:1236 length:1161 start_codon:yes stop_codon:yes gene_type:complete
MKNMKFAYKPLSIACLTLAAASANGAVTIYDDAEVATVSVDASFNTFYVNSSIDGGPNGDREQSRVKMGFLPNWLGMSFSKQVGDMKVGGRSSFWVTINDTNTGVTSTGIDVRQFYATLDADWGQVLLGKDFTLFNRSNIFLDEILLGYGNVNDTLGLVDGQGVSFGNIGSGYTYPFPASQIRYTSPTFAGGLKVAVALVDPSPVNGAADREESVPRIEGEVTYSTEFDGGSVTAWVGFLNQSSESSMGDVDSTGTSYGVKVGFGGVSLHASGYSGEGIGILLGPTEAALGLAQVTMYDTDYNELDSQGYLLQASYTLDANRFVLSYGENEVENADYIAHEAMQAAWFHSYNSNVTFAVEYSTSEFSGILGAEEADTVAVGAIVNF